MAGAEVQEIYCKTLLNRIDVPNFPFKWTLNPYRGCRHACTYCYARPTHEFLGLDAGREFEQRVFAKINAPESYTEGDWAQDSSIQVRTSDQLESLASQRTRYLQPFDASTLK